MKVLHVVFTGVFALTI